MSWSLTTPLGKVPHRKYCPPGPRSVGQLPTWTTPHQDHYQPVKPLIRTNRLGRTMKTKCLKAWMVQCLPCKPIVTASRYTVHRCHHRFSTAAGMDASHVQLKPMFSSVEVLLLGPLIESSWMTAPTYTYMVGNCPGGKLFGVTIWSASRHKHFQNVLS